VLPRHLPGQTEQSPPEYESDYLQFSISERVYVSVDYTKHYLDAASCIPLWTEFPTRNSRWNLPLPLPRFLSYRIYVLRIVLS